METYYGVVRSPADAIKLFEACRLGLLPRVQRRLSEKERQAIRSGSVFVWDEREAGMRRWTDGKSWSASRVAGSFLTYREMEGKRGNGFGGGRRAAGKTPDSGRGSDEDHDDGEPDGYRYKPDGLTKQSFSITNSAGQHLHLIAYYSRGPHDLPLPSNDPALRHIVPAKGMYPESSLAEATPPSSRAPLPPPPYLAPHHQPPPHHGYPQYPHPGYAWPPSPVGTPPYGHGHYAYAQGHPPPPPGPHPYPPHQHSSHHHPPHPHSHQQPHHPYPPAEPNPAHERAPLPPPHSQYSQPQPRQSPHQQHHQPPHQQPQLPAPLPPRMGIPAAQPYPQSQHHPSQGPPPRLSPLESPRSQHLQARAREAVQIEPPRLAPIDAARNQHSPLPAPGQLAAHQQNGKPAPTTTTTPLLPPSNVSTTSPTIRAPSPSPPRSAVSDGRTDNSTTSLATPTAASTRPTLSALLHPSAMAAAALGAGSEPSSANPLSANPVSAGGGGCANSSSAGSSPRTNGGLSSARPQDARPQGEDARAIGVLNRNFF